MLKREEVWDSYGRVTTYKVAPFEHSGNYWCDSYTEISDDLSKRFYSLEDAEFYLQYLRTIVQPLNMRKFAIQKQLKITGTRIMR